MCVCGHDTDLIIPTVLRPQSKGGREPSGRVEGVTTHAAGAGTFQGESAEIGAARFFVRKYSESENLSF